MLSAGPASAHTGFESSDPADGTTVEGAVDEVTIAFSGVAEPAGDGFVVLDPTGVIRTPDLVTSDVEQQRWTLSFDPPLAEGVVGVRWTVQAPDAHPISGSFRFTVVAAQTATTTAADSEQPSEVGTAADGAAGGSTEGPDAGSAASAPDGEARAVASDDAAAAAPDMDAFLQQTDPPVPNAEGVGAFGRLLGFVGTMLGIGGLCFAAVVVRHHRRDLRSVLKAVRYAAAVVVAGTVVDLVAHLAVANNGWRNVFAADAIDPVVVSAFGLAVGLRMAAGVLLFAATTVTHGQIGRFDSRVPRRELVLAGASGTAIDASLPDEDRFTRFSPVHAQPISKGSVVAVIVLLGSFTFDGHTVTEGNRFVTGAVDMIHVVAASIWAGGVVALSVVLWRRYRRGERLNGLEMALRFSVIAVAGGTAVVAAASLGSYNHFVVIPWMNAHPDDDHRSVRIRNTATGEAMLLVVVIVVTAFLVGASSQP